jgi:lysophospholipase L1-like esterase
LKRGLATTLLFLVSVVVSASAAEIALRVLRGPPVHFRYPQPYYVSDTEIGHWLRPNQESFNHHHPLRANSIGIRGPDYARQTPPGTHRILALGDSQTFGNGLALEATWPAQLEEQLAEELPVEVLNAGLPSTDTWQHERMLVRLSRQYEFDSVVLGFYVNDVAPIYRVRAPEERTNTRTKRLAYLAKRSAVATFLWQAYRAMLSPPAGTLKEQRILSGEPDPHIERGWEQVETSLSGMKGEAEKLGVGLLILVIPRRDQVADPGAGRAYNDRIAEIAARLGIPALDVLPALREAYAAQGDELFIPWDGHNSALANGIIAREVARQLR